MFILLLASTVNASNHTKCEIQLTLINLHPNEYSQEFHYYPFAVKLDRCAGTEKCYIWNPATCNCENGKYLESIMDDSVITCDEII